MATLQNALIGILIGATILLGVFFTYDYYRNQNIGYLERRVLAASHNIYKDAEAKNMGALPGDVKILLTTNEKLKTKINLEKAETEAKLGAATDQSEKSFLNAYLQTLKDLQQYNDDIYVVAGTGGQLDFAITDDPRINVWLDIVASSSSKYGLRQPVTPY